MKIIILLCQCLKRVKALHIAYIGLSICYDIDIIFCICRKFTTSFYQSEFTLLIHRI